MKKIIGIITLVVLLIGGGYMYLRFHVLKAKDYKPVVAKEKNVVDLRPAIIAKLQQLVKDGSAGLYRLNIDSINLDIINSKLDVTGASLWIDTATMRLLDKSQKLSNDLFKLKFNKLHIDGIGVEDLLHKDRIEVTNIEIDEPQVVVYHKTRSYNIEEEKKEKKQPLFQRILGTMKMIAIGKIDIRHGTFVLHQEGIKGPPTKLNDLGIVLTKILIDSATQFDQNRFLFAKTANFSAKNYSLPTPDSLYVFSVGSVAVSADKHTMTTENIHLTPKGGKKGFMSKIKTRKEMYDVKIPKLTLRGVNWWAILNNEKWLSSEVDLYDPNMYVYMDPRVPSSKIFSLNNFPHQRFLKIPTPISVKKLNLHNFKLAYEEFNPHINRSGTVRFDQLNAQITNVSNIKTDISLHPIAIANAQAKFMGVTPIKAKIQFYLNKASTGNFEVDIDVLDTLNNYTINTVAEPLAQFTIKRGLFLKGTGHIDGDNHGTKAKVALEYRDLHITPLRNDSNDNGKLRKHPIISFFANKLLIKDNNPGANGQLRQPEYTVDRDHHQNFFNFIWLTIMTGVLKTIGIPVKLIIK